jgi:hypothetical protein
MNLKMLWKPNFENPTHEQYMALLDDEIFLVQCEERLKAAGQKYEARSVEVEKWHMKSKRMRMKKALEKRKTASGAALTVSG